MDQIKIGRFIAEKRREAKLTQQELADKLGLSNRAISKWENGICLPDAATMPELCKILKITINDLFSGEVVDMTENEKKLEENLLSMKREKEENDKRLLRLEWVIGILSMFVLLVPITIGAYLPNIDDLTRTLIVFSGFIPGVIGFIFAMRIEQVAGYYECKHCGHKYVPAISMYFAMHLGRTRYMKCPNCGKYSWQKKVISKD
jgi:transcriptional regulator with XRE-family HTH domain/DNA-directed RNA polymerase subunit RPC12/RpoP